ncbi:unnamed protein product [Phytophthora fragariaefolia]|uniref:Unnamed protein product n=1 Tax=Phytophthora fragariaefolia TaxID=1490495 RepID=A0A9W7CTT8_9STRA|nr:unnamed protein product [Phytophthora fragariaefolia]
MQPLSARHITCIFATYPTTSPRMGLDELKPGNTKRAKDTAISAFMAFVKCEQVEFDYVKRCIEQDAAGKCFVSVLDMFGMYLAFNVGKKGKHLPGTPLCNTSGNAKCGCLSSSLCNDTLSKQNCLAWERRLTASTAPSVTLIDNLPEIPVGATVTLTPVTPLVEVLNHPEEFTALASAAPTSVAAKPKTAVSIPTVYSHVNRLLDRVAPSAGVVDALTSHSFRRGGAQHVNVCHRLTHRWIFDRGAWNMSTTNKGFNYIFNTSKEDHMISKALSGYTTEAEVKTMNLTAFDAETMEKINAFQRSLFTTCYKMESSMYNLSQQVADVLTAYLILHYPRMKEIQANGLTVMRMEAAVVNAGASVAELLAWSSHLAV